jgi:hypothetical protein
MNAPLPAHRIETTLTQDGTLTLDHLPFQAGEAVEVTVLPQADRASESRYHLRGTPVRYQNPMEPIAEYEWDAVQ